MLFVDASREFEQGKNQNTLSEMNIRKILEQYAAFQAEESCAGAEGRVMEEKYSYRATFAELEDNDFNLNIPRYVDTFEEEEPVDIPSTMREIKGLKAEVREVEKVMAGYLVELGFNQERGI